MATPRYRLVLSARAKRERAALDALASELAREHGLSEVALRKLLDDAEHVATRREVPPAQARAKLRRAAVLVARAQRDLGEADALLRRALLGAHQGRDAVQAPALARALSDEQWAELPRWLDALDDVAERVLPELRSALAEAAGEKGKREPDPVGRSVAELARAFWDAERERIRAEQGETVARRMGAATAHYVDKDGGRDHPPVRAKNRFSAFFADLGRRHPRLGWTVPRCETELGRHKRKGRKRKSCPRSGEPS